MNRLLPLAAKGGVATFLLLAGTLLFSSHPAHAATCTKAAPTTADGYQQLLRGSINNKWYTADFGGSVSLPNGKILWAFGDTLMGATGATRGGQMINNSAILTDKGCATSITGPADANGNPTSWMQVTGTRKVSGVNDYYWANTPFMDGSTMYMFLSHMYNDASGFHIIGSDLAQFDVSGSTPKLTSTGMTPASRSYGQTPAWGAAVVRTPSYTYVYGGIDKHETWVFGQYYYVARIPNGKEMSQTAWRYWNGSTWSTNQADAQSIIPGTAGVGASASVWQKADGTYVMTSKKYDIVGSDVVAWTAPSPTGPWTESKTLLSPVPVDSTVPSPQTYFGLGHPAVKMASGKLLLSWSLNSGDASFFGDPRYGVYFAETEQP